MLDSKKMLEEYEDDFLDKSSSDLNLGFVKKDTFGKFPANQIDIANK